MLLETKALIQGIVYHFLSLIFKVHHLKQITLISIHWDLHDKTQMGIFSGLHKETKS